jgi:hypothetical protein
VVPRLPKSEKIESSQDGAPSILDSLLWYACGGTLWLQVE